MEKLKEVAKKNKAATIVVIIIVVLLGGYLLRRHFKKAAAVKAPKTQQVKTNPDGTPVVKSKKSKNAAPADESTTPATSTSETPAASDTTNVQ